MKLRFSDLLGPKTLRLRRWLFVLIVGLGGISLLAALGVWQTQRLIWKNGIIAEIEARLAGAPTYLEGDETFETHNYRRAIAEGQFTDEPPARFLTSLKPFGPGFRIIHTFELLRGGRILIDRGFVRQGETPPPPSTDLVALTGVLHWPAEKNAFTPNPNLRERLWFDRDVASLAEALDAQPVMLVLGENESRSPISIPVSTAGIPNNHLAYAITWYSLAVVWFVMTVVTILRWRRSPGAV